MGAMGEKIRRGLFIDAADNALLDSLIEKLGAGVSDVGAAAIRAFSRVPRDQQVRILARVKLGKRLADGLGIEDVAKPTLPRKGDKRP